MALGHLSVVLDANIANFQSDLGRAARIAEQQSKAMQRSFEGAAKSIGAALAGAFAVTKVTQYLKGAIDLADQMNSTAQKVGIAAGTLSALKLEADKNGGSFEQLNAALQIFSKSVGAASYSATSQQAAAFKAMGISIKDASGHIRPMQDLFLQAATKLSGYREGISKTILAQQLFGRSGAELIPMLNALGTEGLAKVTEQAKALGVYIGGDAAKAANDFNEKLATLKDAFDGLALTASQTLLPALTSVTEKTTEFIKQLRDNGTIQQFANALGFIVNHFAEIAEFIIGRALLTRIIAGIVAIGGAATSAAGAVGLLRGALALVGGPIGLIATAIAGSLVLLEEYNNHFDTLTKTIKDSNDALNKFLGLAGAAQFKQANSLALSIQQDNQQLQDLQTKLEQASKDRDEAAKDAAGSTFSAAGEAARGQLALMDGQLTKLKSQQAQLTQIRDKSQAALDQYRKDVANPNSALHAGQTRIKPPAPTLVNTADAAAKLKALQAAYDALATAAQKANESKLTPDQKALADYTDGMRQLAKLAGDYVAKGGDAAKAQNEFLQGKAGLWEQYQRAVQAAAAANQEFTDSLQHQLELQKQAIDIQVQSIGMGDKEADRLRQINQLQQQGAEAIRQLTLERDKYLSTDPQYQVLTKHIQEQQAANDAFVSARLDGFKQQDAAQSNWANGFKAAMANFNDQMNNAAQQMKDFTNSFIDGFGNAFVQFATGAESAKKAFGDFIDSLFAQALKFVANKALQELFNSFSNTGGSDNEASASMQLFGDSGFTNSGASSGSGGFWGSVAGFVGSLFSSGKAAGGPVQPYSMQRVNERGPELLTVAGKDFLMMGGQGGTVTPNDRLGNRSQVINVNVQPTSSRRTASQVAQAVARQQQLAIARG